MCKESIRKILIFNTTQSILNLNLLLRLQSNKNILRAASSCKSVVNIWIADCFQQTHCNKYLPQILFQNSKKFPSTSQPLIFEKHPPWSIWHFLLKPRDNRQASDNKKHVTIGINFRFQYVRSLLFDIHLWTWDASADLRQKIISSKLKFITSIERQWSINSRVKLWFRKP